jgi:hypothetical protein
VNAKPLLGFVLVSAALFPCGCRSLSNWVNSGAERARVERSMGEQTYLVVEQNPQGCPDLRVDGLAWQPSDGDRAPIEPGRHLVSCPAFAEDFEVDVSKGDVLHITNYWGP